MHRFSRRLFLANGLAAAGSIFSADLRVFAGSERKTVSASALADLKGKLKGTVVTPADANFKEFVYGELWNKYQPKRSPDFVARVANEQDVCEAIKFAKSNKLKVVVRGGGHNWCCPSLRNGGMMLDLTDLNKIISIDAEKKRAVVQPILSNREVQKALNAQGLAFPSGHCPEVKLSGYLLGGGMSWNQGTWGPGVGSVEAIEIVTPDGELIKASAKEHQDYFWAARGAGCGFFGVAVRYHLKLYPLPQYITASHWTYSMNDMEAVADWINNVAHELPSNVELSIWLSPASPALADKAKDHNGRVVLVTASTFAETEAEAAKCVKLLNESPLIDKCLDKSVSKKVSFQDLFDFSGALWPPNLRAQVEAGFYNANVKDMFKACAKHYEHAPSPLSVFMFAVFTGKHVPAPLLDCAFSMSSKYYGGPWTQWKDESEDAANLAWHKEMLQKLRPFVAGHYISESDTVTYPHHIEEAFIPKNLARIEELRKKHDPTGVFFDYREALS